MRTELYLNLKIYDKQQINQGIIAFEEIASITLEIREDYYCCIINRAKCDPKQVAMEFENYLIALMNQ